MGEPPGDLFPRLAALRFDEPRHVVEDDDVSGLRLLGAGEHGAPAHQDLPAVRPLHLDLFAPVRPGGEDPGSHSFRERGEPRAQSVHPVEREPRLALQGRVEDVLRHPVERHQAPVAAGGEHARREAREHRLEVGALLLELTVAVARLVARERELARHFVERVGEKPDLVRSFVRKPRLVVARRHRTGQLRHPPERRGEPPRGEDRRPHRAEEADEEDQGEGEHERGLERSAQVDEVAVALERGAHPGFELVGALRDRKQGLHEAGFPARRGARDVHHHSQGEAELVDGIEADVGAALPDLEEHRLVRGGRHEGRGVGARPDDAPLGRHEGDLGRAEHVERVVEPVRRIRLGQIGELHREELDLLEAFAHVVVEGGAAELEGPLQGLLDPHVEPVVDAAMQELDGEEVDQHHRGDREEAEHGHHPYRQPRSGAVRADLPRELGEVADEQGGEDRQPEDGERDERRVELAEPGRVPGDVAQHEERQQQERDEGDEPPPAPARGVCVTGRDRLARRSRHGRSLEMQAWKKPSMSASPGRICRPGPQARPHAKRIGSASW